MDPLAFSGPLAEACSCRTAARCGRVRAMTNECRIHSTNRKSPSKEEPSLTTREHSGHPGCFRAPLAAAGRRVPDETEELRGDHILYVGLARGLRGGIFECLVPDEEDDTTGGRDEKQER